MSSTLPTNYFLSLALSLIFQLWPILILLPVFGGHSNRLGQMLLVWMLVLAVRIFLAVNTTTAPNYASLFHILPEPKYTLFFGATGGLIMVFSLLRSYFSRRA